MDVNAKIFEALHHLYWFSLVLKVGSILVVLPLLPPLTIVESSLERLEWMKEHCSNPLYCKTISYVYTIYVQANDHTFVVWPFPKVAHALLPSL